MPVRARSRLEHDRASFMMQEADISVSFSGIMIGVCTFLLGFTVNASLSREPTAASFAILGSAFQMRQTAATDVMALNTYAIGCLVLSTFAFFYATTFYAKVSGYAQRLRDRRACMEAMQAGNIVSEFLGVFPLLYAFPILIFTMTRSVAISSISVVIVVAGFLAYSISSYDMLERYIHNGWSRRGLQAVILAVMLIFQVTVIHATECPYNALIQVCDTGLFVGILIALTSWAWQRREGTKRRGRR